MILDARQKALRDTFSMFRYMRAEITRVFSSDETPNGWLRIFSKTFLYNLMSILNDGVCW